ncbi:MAG: RidA family protein [Clostridia bacterium]|nr:RidA family protein [Clostridia bacterium]
MELHAAPESENRPGHYSMGVSCGGFAFISGQLPIDWRGTGKLVCGGIEKQAEQALNNLVSALNEIGLTINDVIKTTVLIAGAENWPVVDGIYGRFFGAHRPARTIIPTTSLHYGALIEIEAIARERS